MNLRLACVAWATQDPVSVKQNKTQENTQALALSLPRPQASVLWPLPRNVLV